MSEQPYTPDTETVCEQYTREQPPHIGTVASKSAEFDRWLAKVKAEAFDEGWKARAERDPLVMNVRGHSAPPPPHGLNPYRQEADQ